MRFKLTVVAGAGLASLLRVVHCEGWVCCEVSEGMAHSQSVSFNCLEMQVREWWGLWDRGGLGTVQGRRN